MDYSPDPYRPSFNIGYTLVSRLVAMLALLTGVMFMSAVWAEFNGFSVRLLLLLVASFGLLVGLRWQLSGAVVAIGAGFILGWDVYRTLPVNQFLASTVYSSPFIIGGVLYLVDWLRQQLFRR